ncbi:transposase [Streptomyces sp. URMC 127]|uniref:transposase n=1 Tax=Streptomyces sp. URMC 127 TaxID=3423402 RepID=UPI003F1C49EF
MDEGLGQPAGLEHRQADPLLGGARDHGGAPFAGGSAGPPAPRIRVPDVIALRAISGVSRAVRAFGQVRVFRQRPVDPIGGWAGTPVRARPKQLRPLPLPGTRGGAVWESSDHRAVIEAVLWKLATGSRWEDIPTSTGSYLAVSGWYYAWEQDGTWRAISPSAQGQGHVSRAERAERAERRSPAGSSAPAPRCRSRRMRRREPLPHGECGPRAGNSKADALAKALACLRC